MTIIVRPTERNVTVQTRPRQVSVEAVAARGPQGERGPAGPAGSTDAELVADGPIGGGRVVVVQQDGTAAYASQLNADHRWLSVGVTTGAGADGDLLSVRTHGILDDSSWTWTPRAPLFLGTNGLLTHVEPAHPAFSRIVAVAISATSILVDPQPPITLAE